MKVYKIKHTAGISLNEFYNDLENGGRIIIYGYCVSIVAKTFRLTSSPYFIKPGEKYSKYRMSYTIYSLLFGWWGLPWGPIYTIDMIRINYKNGGGVDTTDELLDKIKQKYPDTKSREVLAEDLTIEFHEKELTH
jgi:hypothetical protein